MWFNEYYAGKIGRITTAGVVTEYPVGLVGGGSPTSVAVGSDGALWFPESNDDFAVHTLGRITTDGVVTECDVPTQFLNYSAAIAAGPDGALWFTDGWTNRIMRAAFAPGMVVANTFLPYGMTEVSYSARLIAHGDPFI
jgi:virginiamycin B lyase